jgi:hypothetical protein
MGKKSSLKKSFRKTRQVVKQVVVEVEEDDQDLILDEIIEYLDEKKKEFKFQYVVEDDKNKNRKLQIFSMDNNWLVRCSRRRFLVRTFKAIPKVEQAELEEKYGFSAETRDVGACENRHFVIWQVVEQNGQFSKERVKSWIDFLCDNSMPKPKITVNRKYF